MSTPKLKIIYDFDNTLSPSHWVYNESTFKCGLIISRALGDLAEGAVEEVKRRVLAEQLLAQAVIDLDARQPQLPLPQQHELIRPPAEYAEFFARIAAANTSPAAGEP